MMAKLELGMPDFHYTARTVSGDKVAGVIEADTEAAVLRTLDDRSLFPVEVAVSKDTVTPAISKIRASQLGGLYSQLADLLHSGVPLLRALQSIMDASLNAREKQLVRELRDSVAEGQSLTQAMRDRPSVFSTLHVAMVEAGERASFLEDVLYGLATFIERIDELRGKVWGALIYPVLLTIVGTGVMIAALTLFVPRFEPLLEGVEKPLPTLIIFGMSSLLRESWELLIVGGIAVVAIGVYVFRKVGWRMVEVVSLRLPIVGSALRMVAIARFCRILGTLLANGVPLLQALAISKGATGSAVLAEHIEEASNSVRAGAGLAEPLAEGGMIPGQILSMIAVAEESNQLQKVLVQIADTVERRTHREVDQVVRLLEPLVLCVVAAGIGFLALGLLLPIFTLAGSLGAK
jgi:general secretion pathway protein F